MKNLRKKTFLDSRYPKVIFFFLPHFFQKLKKHAGIALNKTCSLAIVHHCSINIMYKSDTEGGGGKGINE